MSSLYGTLRTKKSLQTKKAEDHLQSLQKIQGYKPHHIYATLMNQYF